MKWSAILPSLEAIVSLLKDHSTHYLSSWWATFSISVAASILSLVLALVFAVAGLRFPFITRLMSPLTTVTQSFPLQAIAPIVIIAIGHGFHSKLIIVIMIAFFPIYISIVSAFQQTPPSYMAHLKITQASFRSGVMFIRFPIALPLIISSTKVGFTLAVLGAVVAEFIMPNEGLGREILMAQSQYNINVIYLCVFFLIIQGLVVYVLLSAFETRLLNDRKTED